MVERHGVKSDGATITITCTVIRCMREKLIKQSGGKEFTGTDWKTFSAMWNKRNVAKISKGAAGVAGAAKSLTTGLSLINHGLRPAQQITLLMLRRQQKVANGATGGPDSDDEDTDVPDAVLSRRPVERSQEMEDTLNKELYNRVIISDRIASWKRYLLLMRLKRKVPCRFRSWSKKYDGEENDCVEKDLDSDVSASGGATGSTDLAETRATMTRNLVALVRMEVKVELQLVTTVDHPDLAKLAMMPPTKTRIQTPPIVLAQVAVRRQKTIR